MDIDLGSVQRPYQISVIPARSPHDDRTPELRDISDAVTVEELSHSGSPLVWRLRAYIKREAPFDFWRDGIRVRLGDAAFIDFLVFSADVEEGSKGIHVRCAEWRSLTTQPLWLGSSQAV